MSGGRDAVRMTDAEVAAFLASQTKVQVATIGPHGAPHLATLFYVLRDGDIAFWTYGRSQKVVNLERDPRVSALVEAGEEYVALRGVSVTGHAEIVRDPAAVAEVGGLVALRMTGLDSLEALGAAGRAEVERQARKRVAVIVRPEHVASWDHAKLLSRP